MDGLREIPGREALKLRAEASQLEAEALKTFFSNVVPH